MTAEFIVAVLERDGLRLRIDGDGLKLEAPADRMPSPAKLARLRENKAAVLEYLRGRSQPPAVQFFSFPTPSGSEN